MWKEQFLNLTKGIHTLKSAMKTQKQLEKQETSGLARCRRLRYPTMAMAARLEKEEHENDACMVCHACEIPVNSDGRCPKCNSVISKPGRK